MAMTNGRFLISFVKLMAKTESDLGYIISYFFFYTMDISLSSASNILAGYMEFE